GVGGHPAEPAGPADAAALGDVLQDRLDLLLRQPGVEQGRALAPGEAGLAGAAAEHAARLPGPVAAGHGQVSGAPLAGVGAVGIQAAEARQVVHGAGPAVRSSGWTPSCVPPERYTTGPRPCNIDESPGFAISLANPIDGRKILGDRQEFPHL